jgi:hypothetical protein
MSIKPERGISHFQLMKLFHMLPLTEHGATRVLRLPMIWSTHIYMTPALVQMTAPKSLDLRQCIRYL